MGMIIRFPTGRQSPRRESVEQRGPGQVVILPVIRVERLGERPAADSLVRRPPSRKRRRRVSQS